MNGFEILLPGLIGVSLLTGLTTQGIKKVCIEKNIKYQPNTLAGIVSVIISTLAGIGYAVITETAFTASFGVVMCAFTFLSWLCAMLGYDKVIQTITQAKTSSEED